MKVHFHSSSAPSAHMKYICVKELPNFLSFSETYISLYRLVNSKLVNVLPHLSSTLWFSTIKSDNKYVDIKKRGRGSYLQKLCSSSPGRV